MVSNQEHPYHDEEWIYGAMVRWTSATENGTDGGDSGENNDESVYQQRD